MSKYFALLRRILLGFVCCLVFAGFVWGQEETKTWEEKYSDELFVYDLVEEVTRVNKDCTFDTKVHYVISIQKEGAKETGIGEIKLSYNRDCETIKDIKAFVIGKDGKKNKL